MRYRYNLFAIKYTNRVGVPAFFNISAFVRFVQAQTYKYNKTNSIKCIKDKKYSDTGLMKMFGVT